MRFSISFTSLSLFCGLLCVTACQGKDQHKKPHDHGSAVPSTTKPVPPDPSLQSALNPTDAAIRTAFLGAALSARQGQPAKTFGTPWLLDIPVAGHEPLHLSITFMPPLKLAKKLGTEFGMKNGNNEDPQPLITDVFTPSYLNTVHFIVVLQPSSDVVQDENAELPPISFQLLVRLTNDEEVDVKPAQPPRLRIHLGRNFIQEDVEFRTGLSLDFPLSQSGTKTPLIRSDIRNITLTIAIGAETKSEEFPL